VPFDDMVGNPNSSVEKGRWTLFWKNGLKFD
jgi:hypothetical protein